MNEFFKRIREQIAQIWGRMNKGQRIGVVASLATLFIALGLMMFVSSRPEKHVLYTGLTAEDAQIVTKKLEEDGVKYEVETKNDDSTTITVVGKKPELDEIRLGFASEGIPKSGGIGYEFLEKQGFGETKDTFDTKKQRAIETELKRTIERINVVKNARVQLAVPEETVFIDKEVDKTASVMIELKPNETINERQVSAITHLVAQAIPNLKTENVTVVDNNGNLLTSGEENQPLGMSAKQWEIQRNYQAMVQRQVQSMLDRSLGPNKALARVGVELDFSKLQEDMERYTEGAVVSEQNKKEGYEGGEVKPGGPNGTTSNIPSYPGIMGQGPSVYSQNENTKNYNPTKTLRQYAKAPAEVKKITVGVLVDEKPDVVTGMVPVDTPAKIRELEKVVALAAGFDINDKNRDGSKRGEVKITRLPFMVPTEEVAKEEPWWLKYLPLLLLVAIAFITFLMLGAMLQPKRQIPARAPRKAVITPAAALPTAPGGAAITAAAIPAAGAAGATVAAMAGAGGAPLAGGIPQVAGAETPRGFWESLEEQREEAERRLLADIETALQDSPKISADLLRNWMKQDKGAEGGRERARA